MNSLVGSAVSRFSFSKRIVVLFSLKVRSAVMKSVVLRANREMDLHTTRSILPSPQCRMRRLNPVRLSLLVPEIP